VVQKTFKQGLFPDNTAHNPPIYSPSAFHLLYLNISVSCSICESPYLGSLPSLLRKFEVDLEIHPASGSCVRAAFLFTAAIGFKANASEVSAALQRPADGDAENVESWLGPQRRMDDVVHALDFTNDSAKPNLSWVVKLCRVYNMNATVFCPQMGMARQHGGSQLFKLVIRPDLPTAYLGYAGGFSWHPVMIDSVTDGSLAEAIRNAPAYQLTAFEADSEETTNGVESQSGSEGGDSLDDKGADSQSDDDNPYEDDKSVLGSPTEAATYAGPLLPTDYHVTLYELLSDESYVRCSPRDTLQEGEAEPIFGPVAARSIAQLSFSKTEEQAMQELAQLGQKLVYSRSIDLDGLFGLIRAGDLCKAFVEGANILANPRKMAPYDVRKLNRSARLCGRPLSGTVWKIGRANSSLGKDVALYAMSAAVTSDQLHQALQLAITLPCTSRPPPHCTHSATNRLAHAQGGLKDAAFVEYFFGTQVLACYQRHITQMVPDVLFYIQALQLKESLFSTCDEDAWMLEKSICEAFDVRFIQDLSVDFCIQSTPQVMRIADDSLVEDSPFTALLRQSCLGDYVGGSGICIYPMFFSNELGNAYRNGKVGRCEKVNFYATVYSLLRPKGQVSPFAFLNVGKLACEYLTALPGDTEKMFWELTRLIAENTRKVQRTLEAAGGKTAGIRAELRCSLGDLAGQMALYCSRSEDIQRYAIAVPSNLLMRYVRSQTQLLTKAMSQCLLKLCSPNPLPVIKRLIVSASILESLQTATLLSGSQRGYGNELVWGPGGLGLKEVVTESNMLGFYSPGWIQGVFDFVPAYDALVEVALMRITGNDESFVRKWNICGKMAHPGISLPLKIENLIRTYAVDLGKFLKLDIDDPLTLLKDSPISLARGYEVRHNCVLAIDAVGVLFNPTHLKFGPWRLPYLYGTRVLKELNPGVDIDPLIVKGMRALRVAYVHYCTGNDRSQLFARSGTFWRLEYEMSYSVPGGAYLMARQVGVMQAANTAAGVNASREELQMGKRRKVPWTEPEDEDLAAGMRKYGFSNWKKIAMDPSYSFFKGSRSATQLKDRARTLIKQASLEATKAISAKRSRPMLPLAELDAIIAASINSARGVCEDVRVDGGGDMMRRDDVRQSNVLDVSPRLGHAEETLDVPIFDELPSLDSVLGTDNMVSAIFEIRLSNVIGEAQRDVLRKYLESRRRSGGLFAFYCSIVFPGPRPNHPTAVARPSNDVFAMVRDALVKTGVLIPDGSQYAMGGVAYRFV
jgi:hypothetical protein